jgi:hypothetical protein
MSDTPRTDWAANESMLSVYKTSQQLERELVVAKDLAESNGKLAHDLGIKLTTLAALVGTVRQWLDLPVRNVSDISPEAHSHEIGNALAAIAKAKEEQP